MNFQDCSFELSTNNYRFLVFIKLNEGEVFLENFTAINPQTCISIWFSVILGNFTLSKSKFESGTFNQILYAYSGTINVLDCQIFSSIFLKDGFSFTNEDLSVVFNNMTFFNNSLSNSFILFKNSMNSLIVLTSLMFSSNHPSFYTLSCRYIYFNFGTNNTISLQSLFMFTQSTTGNFSFLIIYYKLTSGELFNNRQSI